MAKRNLLLCFDAFGTLFRPKLPIEKQYAEIAIACGLAHVNPELIRPSFKKAFRAEYQAHPNYGRQDNMGATQWWTNVIHNTFRPLLSPAEAIPEDLAPRLLRQFSSGAGYDMDERLPGALRMLKQAARSNVDGSRGVFDHVVVGVITNSDDRVPAILASFGLEISPLRYGQPTPSPDLTLTKNKTPESPHIDFHCMSYDVGAEKPDARMFRAAESLVARVLAVRGDTTLQDLDIHSWHKLFVGDDYDKDIVGALQAGWHPMFLRGEGERHPDAIDQVQKLEDCPPEPLDVLFSLHPVVRVDGLGGLISWLTRSR